MKKIKSIYFQYLRNEAHYEFSWTFDQLLDVYTTVKAMVATLYGTFSGLLALEKKLLDAARASQLTAQLVEADRRVDHAVSAINATINAAMLSLNAGIVDAARRLHARLGEFGNIRGKAYEEETAAVQVLLDDLNTTFAWEVKQLDLDDWVAELTEATGEFTRIYLERGREKSQRPTERLEDVRREIEGVYRGMVTVIDANEIVSPTPNGAAFIAELNVQVDYFNEHNHHHARKDIGVTEHCVVEPVETQQYTEKAVTPIPRAYYREGGKPTVELVFAKDFFVTYKNNVDVGTADLTLHGKGVYKGQKTVTFNIAR
ncbi:MAG: DUF6261 family protein [Odoribacteraceae bacterium]|jgi:hypothetical protein|nr:DUF6261 family protein [Odoribacteraceae bacterium]